MARIDSVEALRARYREPVERVVLKELDHLDPHCRQFIAHAPFLVLATVGADGAMDASPRGDAPGFVRVVDDRTLVIPDRPGNNRIDSLTNLMDRPSVGLLLMIPGTDETLRVNGTAEVRDDEDLRAAAAVDGRLPATVIVVHVHQAYLHCAKAFMRSGLWDPASWPKDRPVPTLGVMIKDQIGGDAPVESQEAMLARYRDALY